MVVFYEKKIKIEQGQEILKRTSLHCKFKQSQLFQVFPNISCFNWLPRATSHIHLILY